MEEKLLSSPYVILLNNEKVLYTKSVSKENYVALSMKPQAVGQIIIGGSEYTRGLDKIIPSDSLTEVTTNIPSDSLTEVTTNIPSDYFIWLILGAVMIIVAIVLIIIIRKIKK